MPEPEAPASHTQPGGPKSPPRSGALLYAGRRVLISPSGLTIGRSEANELVIAHERVSREHARVVIEEDGFWIADLDSLHGTSVNGERFRDDRRRLSDGDTIAVGDRVLRFLSGQETRIASRELPIVGTEIVHFDGRHMTIGRDERNDVVLADPNVSRFHAEVVGGDDGIELADLGSRNGTRLDGEFVEAGPVQTGSEIGIGPFRLVFDGTSFLARDDRGTLRLDAEEVAVKVGDKQLLAKTSLSIGPGEFIGIIGESGSGKSTLIKALAGVTTPSEGLITVNGEPVASRLTDIGYVPQDEIVHARLSVVEALRYTARLRLPQDASKEELELTVVRVLDELALTEHAATRIGSLSGGQRKRAGVAAELLSRPSLLFLDEPTTGLDPGLESRMMVLLRELAGDSRAVAVVTHATKSLSLCDKVAVMGRGGELSFYGSPDEALQFFGVESHDAIYTALDERPPIEWRRKFERLLKSVRSQLAPGLSAGAPARGKDPTDVAVAPERKRTRMRTRRVRKQAGFRTQTRILSERYLQIFLRDRRNLLLLIGQVPLLALAIVGLFPSGVFDRPGGDAGDGLQLIFLLVTTTIWLGAIDASREIIKERSVFARESAVGARIGAYLTSKALVLFALVVLQTLLLAAIVLSLRPLNDSATTYAIVLATLVMTGFVAVGMGLIVSAAVNTQDQATSFIPLVLIPQLLFAGAIVPVAQMTEPVKTLSGLIFAQWSYAGIGSVLDMNARIAEDLRFSKVNEYGPDFFNLGDWTGCLILLGFLVAFFAIVSLLLRTRTRQ